MKLQDYRNISKIFESTSGSLSQFTDVENRSINFYDEVNTDKVKIDCAVYDFSSGDLVEYLRDVDGGIQIASSFVNIPENALKTILTENNLFGNYVGVFHFYRDFFPEPTSMYLDEISPSRKEIRLKLEDTSDQSPLQNMKTDDVDPNMVVDFVDDNRVNCVSYQIDNISFEIPSLILKVYEDYTLSTNININDTCEFVVGVADSYFEIQTNPFPPGFEQPARELSPNFNIKVNQGTSTALDYKSYDNLIVSSSYETEILKKIKENRFTLDIDYSDYSNFVHYSSAEKRVANFRNKVRKIENYNVDINALLTLTSSVNMSQSLYVARTKRDEIISNFDGYEKFMYYESGSTFIDLYSEATHSVNWPKTTTSKPHVLYDSTASEATQWFSSQSLLAQDYDSRNSDYIIYAIAENIRNDGNNEDFINFSKMIGHAFDNIKLYADGFSNRNVNRSGFGDGVPKDASWYLAKDMGISLPTVGDAKDLSEYLLGYSSSGTYVTSSENQDTMKENTFKLWKRILSNIPYILKSKGTERSVRGVFNAFGIPSYLYTLKEYGGPDIVFKDYNLEQNAQTLLVDDSKFLALNFYGEQNVEFPWQNYIGDHSPLLSKKSDTIEFRFKTGYSTSPYDRQVLIEGSGSWAIVLERTGSTYDLNNNQHTGVVRFILSSSTGYVSASTVELPVFDDTTYWNVMLTRETGSIDNTISQSWALYVQKYDYERFTHKAQTNFTPASSQGSSSNASYTKNNTLFIGGSSTSNTATSSFGAPVSGTIDNLKLWNTKLNEYVFDFHTQVPSSYLGNTISASFVDLALWYKLNENHDLSVNAYVTDSNYTYPGLYGTASNFSNNPYTYYDEQEFIPVPDVATVRAVNNKVRVETNYVSGSQLYVNTSVETSSFDNYGLDNSKFIIDFSLTDVINKDIFKSFNIFIDDYIANPSFSGDSEYYELQNMTRLYLSKFTKVPNINTFLKNVSRALETTKVFDVIQDVVPGRIKNPMGLGIENTILDRGKIKTETLSTDYKNLKNTITASDVVFDNDYPTHEGIITAYQDLDLTDSLYRPLNSIIDYVRRDINIDSASLATTVIDMVKPYYFEPTGSVISEPSSSGYPLIQVKANLTKEWYRCFTTRRVREFHEGTLATGTSYNDGVNSGSNLPDGTNPVEINKVPDIVPVVEGISPSRKPRLRADSVKQTTPKK